MQVTSLYGNAKLKVKCEQSQIWMQASDGILYDISDGLEEVPVLCDDPQVANSFVYVASCPEPDLGQATAAGVDGCSCLNGCSETDFCPYVTRHTSRFTRHASHVTCRCSLLLPGTSVNMRECGSACACSANRCCRSSPVSSGLKCRLLVRSTGAKGLGRSQLVEFDRKGTSHAPVQVSSLWKLLQKEGLYVSTRDSE